jgi:hypothetical protein
VPRYLAALRALARISFDGFVIVVPLPRHLSLYGPALGFALSCLARDPHYEAFILAPSCVRVAILHNPTL